MVALAVGTNVYCMTSADVTAKAIVQYAVEWYERIAGRVYHALWDLRGQPVRIEIEELMFGLRDHLVWVMNIGRT